MGHTGSSQISFPVLGGPGLTYNGGDRDAFVAKVSLDVQIKDDLLGTWSGQGVYYRNSDTGGWVKLATPATQIAAGDLDGDGIDDLIGIWPRQSGVRIKYSSDNSWEYLSSTADWIATGKMRAGGAGDGLAILQHELPGPFGGFAEGPFRLADHLDLSAEGPGGLLFLWQEEKKLVPHESGTSLRIPGPGEPGFNFSEQKNLIPGEDTRNKKERRK